MSEDYYKGRISELERELEAAHAELGQYGADIKMLEKKLEQDDEQKLWELYKIECAKHPSLAAESDEDQLACARWNLKVWKERK